MKAIAYTKYGSADVFKMVTIDRPVPKDNEVLVSIKSIPISTEDPLQREGRPYFTRVFFGLLKPRKTVLGAEFAGEVVAIGKKVTKFNRGDRVFGHAGKRLGCYAENVCVSQDGLVLKMPTALSFESAAPVCTFLAAWNFVVALGHIESGQKILINGASGAVGSSAVQIARALGAEVTGVCSTKNMELVKSLGAHQVIDYANNDFTQNGEQYDLIFDVANKCPFRDCKHSLKRRGIYLNPVLQVSVLIQMYWIRLFSKRKVMFSATGLQSVSKRKAFLKELVKLFDNEKLKTIIDKRYSLHEVSEAHRYIESGNRSGNVVVNVDN